MLIKSYPNLKISEKCEIFEISSECICCCAPYRFTFHFGCCGIYKKYNFPYRALQHKGALGHTHLTTKTKINTSCKHTLISLLYTYVCDALCNSTANRTPIWYKIKFYLQVARAYCIFFPTVLVVYMSLDLCLLFIYVYLKLDL